MPHGHWKTTTLIAATRLDGIIAPYVLDEPIDGATFRAYIEQMLAPALAPGDIVVMDNLASHKVRGIREAIKATGADLLYLPPYSPNLNPDREPLRQDQVLPSRPRRTKSRRPMEQHRQRHQNSQPRRLRQLLQTCRIQIAGIGSN